MGALKPQISSVKTQKKKNKSWRTKTDKPDQQRID